MRASKRELKRDLPFALAAPVLVAILAIDNEISRIDGGVLILFFFTWLKLTIVQTLKIRSEINEVLGEKNISKSIVHALLGLVLLLLAGWLIVDAAEKIGETLNMNPFLVGATFVAIGTSTPELATTIMSRIRKHDDIGIGTVIGSNIFDLLLTVGLAALIYPIGVSSKELFAGVIVGAFSILLMIPGKSSILGRYRGGTLFLIYVGYISYSFI